MDETWTLSELVGEASSRIAALPAPKNGQVRAVPDERTVRYYAAIGLIDRPSAMRGRTALYGRRHLAQVVAIKRLQGAGRSLADIQALWPTLDEQTLARMSGVELERARAARTEFWKRSAIPAVAPAEPMPAPAVAPPGAAAPPLALRLELAPEVALVIGVSDHTSLTISPADVRALRAAAAPLVTELAKRGLIAQGLGTLEET